MEENKRIENVITVDNTSKRPLGASTYGSLTPPEGPTAEGTTIVYLYEQPPFDLLENYYYDFGKEEFVKAADKPHSYVVWDPATLGWVVNNEAYMDAVMMQRTRLLYLTDWCFVGDVTLEPADLTLEECKKAIEGKIKAKKAKAKKAKKKAPAKKKVSG